MALLRSSKHPGFGTDSEDDMARIYAQLGDADHAIPMLKRLLRTRFGGATFLTPATLRLDPLWDKIRNDPRFQELTLEEVPVSEKSIAVLPFENLSKDEENAFFAGGVQDEILTDLAKVADLKVISRTSVMKYKSDMERNLREIANTLGVSHVVEGSVQRAAARVRVNVQLIDARNDAHVWAEHYDGDIADVFAIQSEIAQQIANQLRAKLSASEKAAIAERPTADLAAYAYYTRARDINIYTDNWEGAEKNGDQKVELLEKATQHDPNFALAYCELAKTHLNLGDDEAEHRKHIELAKTAAETAVRMRPDLPEAHLALARYYFEVGIRTNGYDRAREELAIVRRKLPNNAEALMIEALIGRHQNNWDASLANLQRASELDPRNGEVAYRLEQIYFEMRRYSEFEELVRKQAANGGFALEDPFIQTWLAQMKLAQGDPVAAQSFLEQVPLVYSSQYLGHTIHGSPLSAGLRRGESGDCCDSSEVTRPPASISLARRIRLTDWLRVRAAISRRQWRRLQLRARKYKRKSRTTPMTRPIWRISRILMPGLAENKRRSARHSARWNSKPIAKDSLNGPTWVANLALVYAWTGSATARSRNSKKSRRFPEKERRRHTAISC